MHADDWQLLGIAPTQSSKAIRRAYAKKAKLFHPEEHPRQFQALRRAYEEALNQAGDEESTLPKPLLDEADSPNQHASAPSSLSQPDDVFTRFWQRQKAGSHGPALQELALWWFHPGLNRAWQYQFNRLILDAVLDEGLDRVVLADLVWTIYWPKENLIFEVTANNRRKYMFREKVRQALEAAIWDVRFQFNQHLAQDHRNHAFTYLEDLWASAEYDHYGKRGLLRVLFLRHAVQNPHLTSNDLQQLDRIFQFRNSAESYSQADLEDLQRFEKKRDQAADT